MELTVNEQTELEQLETVITQNVGAFYKVGCALAKIRDSRLYRETHDTFEDYCGDRWDMKRTYAHYLIESSTVIENLDVHNCEQIPANEAQARPLTRLDSPELQQEAWQKVVETAPEGRITARHVSIVVQGMREEDRLERITKQAHRAKKVNLEEIIDEKMQAAFNEFYSQIQRIKMENWRDTSKVAALQMVKLTKDLIEV